MNHEMYENQPPVDWARFKQLMTFGFFAVSLVAIVGYFYRSILAALVISLFLSYLIAPALDSIERKVKISRIYLVIILLLLILGGLGTAMALLVPVVYRESLSILSEVPQAIQYVSERIDPIKKSFAESGFFAIDRVDSLFKNFDLWDNISAQARAAVERILATTPDVFSAVLNAVLIPILVFFMLVELPMIRRHLSLVVPDSLKEPIGVLRDKVDVTLKSVLKGQVIVAGILSVLYMMGLSLIQMESALAIGFIAGMCRIIPYLDVIVGISLSLVIIITTGASFTKLLMVGSVFMLVQAIDGVIITPRVIGERAGLHPGVVIVSVIAFGDWFGFWGVLIAVPMVAVIKVFIQFGVPIYRQSPLYRP